MKMLVRGLEKQKRVELLISLTRMSSETQKQAIIDHLVKGRSDTEAAFLNDVSQSNFNRAISRLNEIAGIVEKIKDIDWAHLPKWPSGNQLSDIINDKL